MVNGEWFCRQEPPIRGDAFASTRLAVIFPNMTANQKTRELSLAGQVLYMVNGEWFCRQEPPIRADSFASTRLAVISADLTQNRQ